MASTRRVRSSVLTPSAGDRSLLAGTPFSGLAYKVEDNGIVREIRVFEDGAMTGVSDDWVDSGGNARLDRAVLDLAGDYGPLVRGDEPVTGIVYFFDGPATAWWKKPTRTDSLPTRHGEGGTLQARQRPCSRGLRDGRGLKTDD